MKVLLVRYLEKPRVIDIEDKLENLHELVGGYIECIGIDDGVYLVCNEEGKIKHLPMNRFLVSNGKIVDVIHGDFFLVGVNGCDFADLAEDKIKKWSKIFREA